MVLLFPSKKLGIRCRSNSIVQNITVYSNCAEGNEKHRSVAADIFYPKATGFACP